MKAYEAKYSLRANAAEYTTFKLRKGVCGLTLAFKQLYSGSQFQRAWFGATSYGFRAYDLPQGLLPSSFCVTTAANQTCTVSVNRGANADLQGVYNFRYVWTQNKAIVAAQDQGNNYQCDLRSGLLTSNKPCIKASAVPFTYQVKVTEVKCRTPLPSSTAPVLIKDVSPFGNPGYLFTPGKETLKNRASTYPLDGLSKSVWSMEVVKGSAKLYAMVLRGTPDTFAAEACNNGVCNWRLLAGKAVGGACYGLKCAGTYTPARRGESATLVIAYARYTQFQDPAKIDPVETPPVQARITLRNFPYSSSKQASA